MINPHGNEKFSPIGVNSLYEKIFNQSALAASLEINEAITDGAIIIDEAKITGITPAELTLIGRNEALAIEGFCPPFPACCTGILRLDNSIKITNAIIRINASI